MLMAQYQQGMAGPSTGTVFKSIKEITDRIKIVNGSDGDNGLPGSSSNSRRQGDSATQFPSGRSRKARQPNQRNIRQYPRELRRSENNERSREPSPVKGGAREERDLSQVECWNCGKKGHFQSRCPEAKLKDDSQSMKVNHNIPAAWADDDSDDGDAKIQRAVSNLVNVNDIYTSEWYEKPLGNILAAESDDANADEDTAGPESKKTADETGKRANGSGTKDPTEQKTGSVEEETELLPSNFIRGHFLYLPLLVNGKRVLAMVDSGAEESHMSATLAEELKLILSGGGKTGLADGSTTRRFGITPELELQSADATVHATLPVIQLTRKVPLIIGLDLFKPFGIEMKVPCKFPNMELPKHDDPHEKPMFTVNEMEQKRDKILRGKLHVILAQNQGIPEGTFCNLPESEISFELIDNKPKYIHQYPIARALQSVLDEQIQKWKESGTIAPAPPGCQWNSPLMVSQQPTLNGETKFRVCIDPRHINSKIRDIKFPLPVVWEMLTKLNNVRHITHIDLKKGFNQFRIKDDSQKMTAFTYNGTQYVFRGAPFGLKTLPAIFQRVMVLIFHGLSYVFVYMDNIIIFSKDGENHEEQVREVLRRLTQANLRVNPTKCHFDQTTIRILGHIVSPDGIALDPEKLQRIL